MLYFQKYLMLFVCYRYFNFDLYLHVHQYLFYYYINVNYNTLNKSYRYLSNGDTRWILRYIIRFRKDIGIFNRNVVASLPQLQENALISIKKYTNWLIYLIDLYVLNDS